MRRHQRGRHHRRYPAQQRDRLAERTRGVWRRGARAGLPRPPAKHSARGRRRPAPRRNQGRRPERHRLYPRPRPAGLSARGHQLCQGHVAGAAYPHGRRKSPPRPRAEPLRAPRAGRPCARVSLSVPAHLGRQQPAHTGAVIPRHGDIGPHHRRRRRRGI